MILAGSSATQPSRGARLIAGLALALLAACTVGPDYRRPDVHELVPAQWKWKPAAAIICISVSPPAVRG